MAAGAQWFSELPDTACQLSRSLGVQSRAMAHATCESFRALQLKADFARLVPDGHAGAGRLVRRVGKGSGVS